MIIRSIICIPRKLTRRDSREPSTPTCRSCDGGGTRPASTAGPRLADAAGRQRACRRPLRCAGISAAVPACSSAGPAVRPPPGPPIPQAPRLGGHVLTGTADQPASGAWHSKAGRHGGWVSGWGKAGRRGWRWGRGRGMGGWGMTTRLNTMAKRIINHFHNFLYVRDTFGRMVRSIRSILWARWFESHQRYFVLAIWRGRRRFGPLTRETLVRFPRLLRALPS